MPGNWKIRKKWNSHKEISQRSRSSRDSGIPTQRRQTISAGGEQSGMETNARRSKSNSALHTLESPEHKYATGRHFMRRPALMIGSDKNIYSTCQEGDESRMSVNFVTISLKDGNVSFKKTVSIKANKTVEELLIATFHKQGIAEEDFSSYHITSCKGGIYSAVDLNDLAMEYMASVIEIQPLKVIIEKSNRTSSSLSDHLSVQSCLEYFEANGLVEIPSNTQIDEESFHLPRVAPLDQIETSWEELPIDPHLKKSLSHKDIAQQLAIWELIGTEYSFLRQLETVINLFMRALELIRRTGLLTEVNYHTVFGYMEEVYLSHEQFWSWTLNPCLEKARQEHRPLDLDVIVLRFPVEISSDFEIYEQHCAFEQTNLRSLDEAMNQKDFRTYLEWCEAQPQCGRLKLKDFLAKPMQRLTKYSLLFKAILNRTRNETHVEELEQMIEETTTFVMSVNGVLRAQEETQRVEEVMKKIIGYNPVELTSEFKELVQPYIKLDLLGPMPDVDITKPRILIVEGKLRYRDNHTRAMVAHVFLFSDMLLITKTRGTDRYVIIRPPFKISQLQVYHKESGTISFIVLNDFNVLADVFTLKAHSADIAQEWTDHIAAAQEFYSSAVERKGHSWRLLESLQHERTLHGISQDILMAEGINGTHWSTQSVSGSPVPLQRSNGEFRRVPSCESTFSTSSSVFPIEPLMPTQERRHSATPLRNSLLEPPQLNDIGFPSNHKNSDSPPLVDSHRVSFPFCGSSSSNRPICQRANSLNTLMVHQYSGDQLLLDLKPKKKRNSFQITLKDATTQTEIDEFRTNHHFSMDSDSTTDGEDFSPILSSPTTPINIVISPSCNSKRHQRSKSDCFPTRKQLSLEERRYSNYEYQSQNGGNLCTSPKSPVLIHFDSNESNGNRPTSFSGSEVVNVKKAVGTTESQSKYEEESSDKLSTTLPPNFRFPTNDGTTCTRYKLHRQSASQLSKIYESTDEESDESTGSSDKDSSFSRGSNLRRSKSSFELSYGNSSKSLLKPPSPLTTHMHRSREKLHKLLSSYDEDCKVSPTFPSRMLFTEYSIEFDDDKSDISVDIEQNDQEDANEDITKSEVKRSIWSNKRIKSAGTNKNKRGFFGLFRGKAVSMESIATHSVSVKKSQNGMQQKSLSKVSITKSKISSPPSKSQQQSQQQKSPSKTSPMKSNNSSVPAVSMVSSTHSKSQQQMCTSESLTESKGTSHISSPPMKLQKQKSPSRSSPKRSQNSSLQKSPAKSSSKSKNITSPKRSKSSCMESPTHSAIRQSLTKNEQQVIDADQDNGCQSTPKTVRKSLEFNPPDHKVVFLSINQSRSKSVPSSPDVSFHHRKMQVVPNHNGLTANNYL